MYIHVYMYIYICIYTCIAGYSLRKPSRCRTSAMCGMAGIFYAYVVAHITVIVTGMAPPPTPIRHPTHQFPATPAPPSPSSPPLDLRPRLSSVEDGASLWMPLRAPQWMLAHRPNHHHHPSQAKPALAGLPPARSGIQMPWLIACRE